VPFTIIQSPVGDITLRADPSTGALTGLFMLEHRHRPADETFGEYLALTNPRSPFAAVSDQLAEYFAGERRAFDLSTKSTGTAFQCAVWAKLEGIPYGTTVTYSELAAMAGRPNAARAVGAANGRNPISIIVPCHRVIGADGSPTGYGGGVERKEFLLHLERSRSVPELI
jgi:O-6-methylguanine DNA methyltransferase